VTAGPPDTPTPNQQAFKAEVLVPTPGAKTAERHVTPETVDRQTLGQPSISSTSLAFRGSPEKQPAQLVSGSVNVGSQE
jgi:hypothetical protein